MIYMVHILLYLLCLLLLCQFLLAHLDQKENSKLLLISFDGFRWDYLQRVGRERTPNFHSLIDSGVHPKSVQNVYVTRTFPNHMTIATGLYEESHGMVDNEFYDPKLNENFTHTPQQMTESKWWDSGIGVLPIWTTNQLAGNNRRSGDIYFVGGLASYADTLPYRNLGQWNNSNPFSNRVDTMIKWFLDEQNPINFGALYFEQPDELGHTINPNTGEMDNMIVKLDTEVIGYLLKKINDSDELRDDLNIIITSDHGMVPVDYSNAVDTKKYVHPSLYTAVPSVTHWHIIPKAGKIVTASKLL